MKSDGMFVKLIKATTTKRYLIETVDMVKIELKMSPPTAMSNEMCRISIIMIVVTEQS